MEQGGMAPMPGGPGEQKKGFSWLKCCLIVGCIAVLLGGGVGAFLFVQARKAFMLDPVRVQALANEVVPCEVPAGYQGFMGINMAGVKMAMIGPEGMMQGRVQPGGMALMIVLMTMPQKQGKDALKSQMETQLRQQGHEISAEKSAEEETVTIRGQPVKVEKMLTKDKQGNDMTAYVIVLEQAPTETNPAGQEIIWIMGAQKSFDKKAMDAFLGSIK